MYQSLHTTLISPDGKPVEIQIRTGDMDLTAEYGIAAHWAYKEGKEQSRVEQENKWLQQFVDWQKDMTDSAQFMDFFRIDLKFDEIFVFTPKGDLFQLPRGSTALDFAFTVHTEVGIHCSGAKVDGKIVPLDKVLRTGCTVEILKTKDQHPSSDWLRIVVTAKAKNRIRRWLKNEEQEKSIQLGKELLLREFRTIKVSSEGQADFGPFRKRYAVETWEALYRKIGKGDITMGSLRSLLKQHYGQPKGVLERVRLKRPREENVSVLVSGMDNMLIRFASCCLPIPGDKIMGYVTRGRGVSVHRIRCPEAIKLLNDKDRLVPVNWNNEVEQTYDIFIEVQGKDKVGLLNEITNVLSAAKINVERASIVTVKGQVRNRFKVQVSHRDQLERTFEELKKIKGVRSVIRKQPGRDNADEKQPAQNH
jgi:GTP pyrophosphokinase